MKKTVGEYIKEKFPNSYSVIWMPEFGIALLAVSNLNIFNKEVANVTLTIFSYIGLFLITVFILILFSEGLSKLFSIFKYLVNAFLLIPRLLLQTYILIVKLLIKKSVVSILEDKTNIVGESFSLRNQTGTDEYWNRIINFGDVDSVELIIQPSENSKHWRIGFKFSQNELFATARFAPKFPLFHLTKDSNENSLKLDYYNFDGKHENLIGKPVIKNYDNETVKLILQKKLTFKKCLVVKLFDENDKQVFAHEFLLNLHEYAKLSAWGDGNEYEIHIKNYISK